MFHKSLALAQTPKGVIYGNLKNKIYGNLWLIDGHFLIKTSRSEVKVNFHFSHLIGFLTNPKREAQINIVFRLYRLIVAFKPTTPYYVVNVQVLVRARRCGRCACIIVLYQYICVPTSLEWHVS